jgi:2-oxoglutarate dehydrogenase E1 component
MATSLAQATYLFGTNADYITGLYQKYCENPQSVDASWQQFFGGLNDNERSLLAELNGASWTPKDNRKGHGYYGVEVTRPLANNQESTGSKDKAEGLRVVVTSPPSTSASATTAPSPDALKAAAMDSIRALMLIRAFRALGHFQSNLDPMGMMERRHHIELDPAHYGFTDADLDRAIYVGGVLGMEYATPRQIVTACQEIYCGTIGVEFMHLMDPAEKSWVQERIEAPRNHTDFTVNGKRAILQRLTEAEGLEQFLHTKYVGTKRFGLDGGEALIPAVDQIMKRGGQLGVREIVVGMAHRGRLNMLTNVLGKSFTALFSEFQGTPSTPDDVQGSGDVKYHMGVSVDRDFDGNTIHLSLTANPSHLEVVNPVVIGKVRAKQQQRNDHDHTQVLPLLLHGDAAFAGQGLVAETLMISEIQGYAVGGTIHIVINNQIGFTTMPQYSRSGPYPTDVAKMLAAPIFHVNGDDPEAVVHVARIATEFRQQFKKDVVIDMVCYRRYGHNEGDEPAFTQPLMYKKISTLPPVCEKYADRLVAEKVVTPDEPQKIKDAFFARLESSFEAAKSYKPNKADFLEGAWTGLKTAGNDDRRGSTAIEIDQLKRLGRVLYTVPASFDINPKISRQLDNKKKTFETGEGIDWGTGELLAYASLIDDGYPVRLSGQDVGRGTFSHRHAIMYDQTSEEKYIALQHIKEGQPKFEVYDSPLSEAAVLGFEYGYSLADPRTLTIWEAQFGDFVNGAQVVIDQFISSGETKWLRMSGLVLLLPHGYEGQGPEHSSARLERFLQMSAEDNWQVCNITTPANYFHALRRQIHRDFRKPLVVTTPKSLLRHKLAVSRLSDMGPGSSFHRVLNDDNLVLMNAGQNIRRVILCSGKVYYDLYEEREKRGLTNVVILRLEQFYPFPAKALGDMLRVFTNADICWCQEEPRNMGGWSFVEPYLEQVLKDIKHRPGTRPTYVGRMAAASPATGSAKRHAVEQAKLVDEALAV